MNRNPLRWANAAFAAAAIVGLATVPSADAQTGRFRRNAGAMQQGGRGYRNGMGNQNNIAVARSLRGTVQLLAQADHDYQGHRALAMRHVETAIRHLIPPAARRAQTGQIGGPAANAGSGAGVANGVAAGGTGKKRMPQATSDQHLQQALQSLTAIQGQLMSGGSTPNHARAATAVQNAIRELNISLGIR